MIEADVEFDFFKPLPSTRKYHFTFDPFQGLFEPNWSTRMPTPIRLFWECIRSEPGYGSLLDRAKVDLLR